MSTRNMSSEQIEKVVISNITSNDYKRYCDEIVNSASKPTTVNMDNKFGYIVNNTKVKVNNHPQYSTDTYTGNMMDYE
jgi:hypothetical protein